MAYVRNWIPWRVSKEDTDKVRDALLGADWPFCYSDKYLTDGGSIFIVHTGVKEEVCRDMNHIPLDEPIQVSEIINEMIMTDPDMFVHKMPIVERRRALRKVMLETDVKEDVGRLAVETSVPPAQYGFIRDICNQRYLERLKQCLPKRQSMIRYMPNFDHPLCRDLLRHIRDEYRGNIDRFKCILIIGSSRIGKSYFMREHLVDPKYCITHSNELEFSKNTDQPRKIFRILDDINWEKVDSMTLKCMINGTTAAVDIKYGTEYLFPLINIILMNKENYAQFRRQMVGIWEFIEENMVIYPEQPMSGDAIQEEEPLYTKIPIPEGKPFPYLFDAIVPHDVLTKFDGKNTNEEVRNYLQENEGWLYSNTYEKYPEEDMKKNYINNPSLLEKDINERYKEWILKQKVERMNEEPQRRRVVDDEPVAHKRRRGGSRKPEEDESEDSSMSICDGDRSYLDRPDMADNDGSESDGSDVSSSSESDSRGMTSVEL